MFHFIKVKITFNICDRIFLAIEIPDTKSCVLNLRHLPETENLEHIANFSLDGSARNKKLSVMSFTERGIWVFPIGIAIPNEYWSLGFNSIFDAAAHAIFKWNVL